MPQPTSARNSRRVRGLLFMKRNGFSANAWDLIIYSWGGGNCQSFPNVLRVGLPHEYNVNSAEGTLLYLTHAVRFHARTALLNSFTAFLSRLLGLGGLLSRKSTFRASF